VSTKKLESFKIFKFFQILRILILQESGLYNKWSEIAQEMRYVYGSEINHKREKYKSEDLTFDGLRGIFILWLSGIFFSILLLIFELYFNEAQIGANMR